MARKSTGGFLGGSEARAALEIRPCGAQTAGPSCPLAGQGCGLPTRGGLTQQRGSTYVTPPCWTVTIPYQGLLNPRECSWDSGEPLST